MTEHIKEKIITRFLEEEMYVMSGPAGQAPAVDMGAKSHPCRL